MAKTTRTPEEIIKKYRIPNNVGELKTFSLFAFIGGLLGTLTVVVFSVTLFLLCVLLLLWTFKQLFLL